MLLSPVPTQFRNFDLLWTLQMSRVIFFAMSKGEAMTADKSEVLEGTLDRMFLKTPDILGPEYGFWIAGVSTRSANWC